MKNGITLGLALYIPIAVILGQPAPMIAVTVIAMAILSILVWALALLILWR